MTKGYIFRTWWQLVTLIDWRYHNGKRLNREQYDKVCSNVSWWDASLAADVGCVNQGKQGPSKRGGRLRQGHSVCCV